MLNLWVREFYCWFGFFLVGVQSGYYSDIGEDVLFM